MLLFLRVINVQTELYIDHLNSSNIIQETKFAKNIWQRFSVCMCCVFSQWRNYFYSSDCGLQNIWLNVTMQKCHHRPQDVFLAYIQRYIRVYLYH